MLAFFQKIGKSLMLPVAVLPAASLLVSFGAFNYVEQIKLGSTVGGFINQYIQPFLAAGGAAIFDNLPLIFAIGLAIGFAGDAVAALTAVIAYQVLTKILAVVPQVFDYIGKDTKLDMGVLGGIIAGGITVYFYNKYHNIKLPEWLGFFSGKRFVPIVTSFSMVIISIILGMIWGPIGHGLDVFGREVVALGGIGAALFGFINRLLIPFGLHHVINSIAWFQIGDFTKSTGEVVHGDLTRFFAGDTTAGMFMTGFFPIMMFALPAAALAMIHVAKPKNRKAIASLFIGLAFSSFLTGITEPIEYAFMFLAPVLYGIHAVLTGVAGYVMSILHVRLGFGFSAGLIDYLVNMSKSENAWVLIPVGLVFFAVYYFLFRIVITKFNLKTPGREDDDILAEDSAVQQVESKPSTMKDKAVQVLALIGGKQNVKALDACITRLRLVLADDKQIDEKGLKALGAAGVMRLGQGAVQIVFGTQSEQIKDEMKKL